MKTRLKLLLRYEIKRGRFLSEISIVTSLVIFYFLIKSNISQELLEFNYHFKDAITYCSLEQYYLSYLLLNFSRSFSILIILTSIIKAFVRENTKERYLPFKDYERFVKGFMFNFLLFFIVSSMLFCVFATSVSVKLSNFNWNYISISYEQLILSLIVQSLLFILFNSIILEFYTLIINKYRNLIFILVVFYLTDKSLIFSPGYNIYKQLTYECNNR